MTDDQKDIHYAWIGLFGLLGSLWRAWFGGSFGYCWRILKYVVGVGIVLLMYWSKSILDWYAWRMYAVCGTFCYFWAMSHGMYFKYWDNTPDAEDRKPLLVKFVMWLCGGEENSRTFWGNCLGMAVRYTYTAILVSICIPNWWFVLTGIGVAICYIPAGLKHNTKIGEFLAGALVFPLLWYCL